MCVGKNTLQTLALDKMERTKKNEEIINQIFYTTCIIYDKDELNFDTASELIQKLHNTLNLAKDIDFTDMVKEIWNTTTESDTVKDIIDLINFKFRKLLTWKPMLLELSLLDDKFKKDLDFFFVKQSLIKINYITEDRTRIVRLYIAIGHRLFKANHDLNKVMKTIVKMIEDEKDIIKYKEINARKQNNIKLHPDKISEFTNLVVDLYEKGYFVPVDSTIPFSFTDVFKALGESLHTNFQVIPVPGTSKNDATKVHSNTGSNEKVFAEYLLHENRYKLADAIKNEFSIEKGKAIRLLLHVLENSNPPIITIVYGQKKVLHTAMTEFFGRNIGRYQSVFDYKVDEKIDKKDLESISTRLNHILLTRQES